MTAAGFDTTWFPAILAVAALAATYVFCVRPMLVRRRDPRGFCGREATSDPRPDLGVARDADLTAQLVALRAELQALRMPSLPQRSDGPVDARRC